MIEPDLIEECRNGNFNNFRKLVECSAPFAYSVAHRLLGDEDQAKDVVQETMVTVWQKIKKIRNSETYKTWMYRIVINKCYDEIRKRKRNQESRVDDHAWELISQKIAEEPSSVLENEETAKIISILTETLSLKQKTIFVLADLEGMTNDEISEITGMARSTIKANLHYARKNISQKIVKYI